MGDFNVSLFLVVPSLRSRGVVIDLAAWYPWKAPDGTPNADSCGIFFLNRPGFYCFVKGLDDLHDCDPSGILWAGVQQNWLGKPGVHKDAFDTHDLSTPPGNPSSKPQSWQWDDDAWPTGTSSTQSWRGAGEEAPQSEHSHSRGSDDLWSPWIGTDWH